VPDAQFDKNVLRSMSKAERRDYLREQARLKREAEQKRRRRNRLVIQLSIVVGSIVVLALIGWAVFASVTATTAMPNNMASYGLLLQGQNGKAAPVLTPAAPSSGGPVVTDQSQYPEPVHITTYVDYQCPYCNQFETTNQDYIAGLVAAGEATLEVHPIAILDNSSLGSKYSTRSANAAACVASIAPQSFLDVNKALFANQPQEGTSGLTDEQLVSIVQGAGVSDPTVASCITDHSYAGFVAKATNQALSGPLPNSSVARLTGTPTVIVNGQQYNGSLSDASAFASFVETIAASASTGSGSGQTSSPTPAAAG